MAVRSSPIGERTGPRCPVCREPTVHDHRPFCSKRCADVDLARWLGGRYVVAGTQRDLGEDAALLGDEGRIPPSAESDEEPSGDR